MSEYTLHVNPRQMVAQEPGKLTFEIKNASGQAVVLKPQATVTVALPRATFKNAAQIKPADGTWCILDRPKTDDSITDDSIKLTLEAQSEIRLETSDEPTPFLALAQVMPTQADPSCRITIADLPVGKTLDAHITVQDPVAKDPVRLFGQDHPLALSVKINGTTDGSFLVTHPPAVDQVGENTVDIEVFFQPENLPYAAALAHPKALLSGYRQNKVPCFEVRFQLHTRKGNENLGDDLTDAYDDGDAGYNPITSARNIAYCLDGMVGVTQNSRWTIEQRFEVAPGKPDHAENWPQVPFWRITPRSHAVFSNDGNAARRLHVQFGHIYSDLKAAIGDGTRVIVSAHNFKDTGLDAPIDYADDQKESWHPKLLAPRIDSFGLVPSSFIATVAKTPNTAGGVTSAFVWHEGTIKGVVPLNAEVKFSLTWSIRPAIGSSEAFSIQLVKGADGTPKAYKALKEVATAPITGGAPGDQWILRVIYDKTGQTVSERQIAPFISQKDYLELALPGSRFTAPRTIDAHGPNVLEISDPHEVFWDLQLRGANKTAIGRHAWDIVADGEDLSFRIVHYKDRMPFDPIKGSFTYTSHDGEITFYMADQNWRRFGSGQIKDVERLSHHVQNGEVYMAYTSTDLSDHQDVGLARSSNGWDWADLGGTAPDGFVHQRWVRLSMFDSCWILTTTGPGPDPDAAGVLQSRFSKDFENWSPIQHYEPLLDYSFDVLATPFAITYVGSDRHMTGQILRQKDLHEVPHSASMAAITDADNSIFRLGRTPDYPVLGYSGNDRESFNNIYFRRVSVNWAENSFPVNRPSSEWSYTCENWVVEFEFVDLPFATLSMAFVNEGQSSTQLTLIDGAESIDLPLTDAPLGDAHAANIAELGVYDHHLLAVMPQRSGGNPDFSFTPSLQTHFSTFGWPQVAVGPADQDVPPSIVNFTHNGTDMLIMAHCDHGGFVRLSRSFDSQHWEPLLFEHSATGTQVDLFVHGWTLWLAIVKGTEVIVLSSEDGQSWSQQPGIQGLNKLGQFCFVQWPNDKALYAAALSESKIRWFQWMNAERWEEKTGELGSGLTSGIWGFDFEPYRGELYASISPGPLLYRCPGRGKEWQNMGMAWAGPGRDSTLFQMRDQLVLVSHMHVSGSTRQNQAPQLVMQCSTDGVKWSQPAPLYALGVGSVSVAPWQDRYIIAIRSQMLPDMICTMCSVGLTRDRIGQATSLTDRSAQTPAADIQGIAKVPKKTDATALFAMSKTADGNREILAVPSDPKADTTTVVTLPNLPEGYFLSGHFAMATDGTVAVLAGRSRNSPDEVWILQQGQSEWTKLLMQDLQYSLHSAPLEGASIESGPGTLNAEIADTSQLNCITYHPQENCFAVGGQAGIAVFKHDGTQAREMAYVHITSTVAFSEDGTLFKIIADSGVEGSVYFNVPGWQRTGLKALDVATGPDGTMIAMTRFGQIVTLSPHAKVGHTKYDVGGGTEYHVHARAMTQQHNIRSMVAAPGGAVWVLTEEGTLRRSEPIPSSKSRGSAKGLPSSKTLRLKRTRSSDR